jgi:hypothetical protein
MQSGARCAPICLDDPSVEKKRSICLASGSARLNTELVEVMIDPAKVQLRCR